MKILVDTSVWSLALRRSDKLRDPLALELNSMISSGQSVYITGIILTELLSGTRHVQQFNRLNNILSAFPLLDLNRNDYILAAELDYRCKRKGIQTSTPDLLIAQAAISNDCELLTTDQDFAHIAKHSSLKLFRGS